MQGSSLNYRNNTIKLNSGVPGDMKERIRRLRDELIQEQGPRNSLLFPNRHLKAEEM
jgi:hypothetical protein